MNSGPFGGLPPNLIPNPQAVMPEAPGAGDAMKHATPFKEALDVDQINANLVFDRPLKLFIPQEILERYRNFEFRYINNIPQEIAMAHNKGFRCVDDPDVVALVADLVAGTDKSQKQYGLMLFARHKSTGAAVTKQNRKQLASIYAGMDPRNKELEGKYTENIKEGKDASKGQFQGPTFRIRA